MPRLDPTLNKSKLRIAVEYVTEMIEVNGNLSMFEIIQSLPDGTDFVMVRQAVESLETLRQIRKNKEGKYVLVKSAQKLPPWFMRAQGLA